MYSKLYICVYSVCIIRTLYWFKKFNIIKEISSLTACINQSDAWQSASVEGGAPVCRINGEVFGNLS